MPGVALGLLGQGPPGRSPPRPGLPEDAAGQTLVILEGEGWVQMEGQPRKVMRKGDVVWIPPTVKHWHGATDKSQMTHTAIQGEVDGQVVTWMELVSDEQYAE